MQIPHDLLQSHGWEQFQRALGRDTWRVDGVLCVAMPLSLGLRYWYAPRSSSRPSESASERRDLAHITQQLQKTGAVFLRMEYPTPPNPPSQLEGGEGKHIVVPRVLRRAVEPEWTWRVSLEPEEDAMVAAMHEKHRYNVRLAERRGVMIRNSKNHIPHSKDTETFLLLLQETARRQGITTHPRVYYETMLRTLAQRRGGALSLPALADADTRVVRSRAPAGGHEGPPLRVQDTDCLLYFAEREDDQCATAVVAYHGDTATYLHGGSSHAHRALMAPHLLHWTVMRDAKRAGMRWYDFGGVTPQSAYRLPLTADGWEGMTRFKQGFGGEAVQHPPMMDLVFRRGWYTMLAMGARVLHP